MRTDYACSGSEDEVTMGADYAYSGSEDEVTKECLAKDYFQDKDKGFKKLILRKSRSQ